MTITPYIPVPETNGEEWDRLEPASALDVLVELVLHGEYNGTLNAKRTRDSMELRGAALGVFQVCLWLRVQRRSSSQTRDQNFVQKGEIREAIVQAMVPVEGKVIIWALRDA